MMANHMNSLPEVLFNLLYILLGIVISGLYWYTGKNRGFKHVAVSAHSVLLLLILGFALTIGVFEFTNQICLVLFYVLLSIPVLSIVLSLKYFTGSKWCHLTHIWNMAALFWTWFIGGMAISGDWL